MHNEEIKKRLKRFVKYGDQGLGFITSYLSQLHCFIDESGHAFVGLLFGLEPKVRTNFLFNWYTEYNPEKIYQLSPELREIFNYIAFPAGAWANAIAYLALNYLNNKKINPHKHPRLHNFVKGISYSSLLDFSIAPGSADYEVFSKITNISQHDFFILHTVLAAIFFFMSKSYNKWEENFVVKAIAHSRGKYDPKSIKEIKNEAVEAIQEYLYNIGYGPSRIMRFNGKLRRKDPFYQLSNDFLNEIDWHLVEYAGNDGQFDRERAYSAISEELKLRYPHVERICDELFFTPMVMESARKMHESGNF